MSIERHNYDWHSFVLISLSPCSKISFLVGVLTVFHPWEFFTNSPQYKNTILPTSFWLYHSKLTRSMKYVTWKCNHLTNWSDFTFTGIIAQLFWNNSEAENAPLFVNQLSPGSTTGHMPNSSGPAYSSNICVE